MAGVYSIVLYNKASKWGLEAPPGSGTISIPGREPPGEALGDGRAAGRRPLGGGAAAPAFQRSPNGGLLTDERAGATDAKELESFGRQGDGQISAKSHVNLLESMRNSDISRLFMIF